LYVKAAKDKFLQAESADAWLIAYAAQAGGYQIITNEVSEPNSKSVVKLPDAAAAMGVKTAKLHDVLARHAAGFFKFVK
jgi:predicted trehalose synthase